MNSFSVFLDKLNLFHRRLLLTSFKAGKFFRLKKEEFAEFLFLDISK